MKKIIHIFLLVLLTIGIGPVISAQNVSVWDGTAAIWTQGSGTEDDPYLIESAQNLAYIAEMVNGGVTTYSGVYFKLTTDLNLNYLSWIPIGNSTNSFWGKFNGDNHFIDSVKIMNSDTQSGLFGRTVMAQITNLGVNTYITSGRHSGGIVGVAVQTEISHCFNTGDFSITYVQTSSTGNGATGGIVGLCSQCTISNCYNTGNISCSNSTNSTVTPTSWSTRGPGVGGIVGETNNEVSISNCFNTGVVSASSIYYNTSAGGICGYYSRATSIVDCYNTGDILSIRTNGLTNITNENYAGGIVGYVKTPESGALTLTKISNCYNTGNVSTDAQASNYVYNKVYAGGILGYGASSYYEYFYIINCYNTGSVSTAFSGTYGSTAGNYRYVYGIGNGICKNCYNIGALSGYDEKQIGNNSSNTNCYYLGSGNSGGGTGKTEAAMKSPSFPILLNCDSIVYVMDLTPNINQGYPIFGKSVCLVTTQQESNITFTSAKLNGTYQPKQFWPGGNADVVGFEYKNADATNYNTVYVNVGTPAEYQLTGLQSGTNYTYRFFIQKDGNTYYGNEVSFTTLSCDLQVSIAQTATEMCDGNSAIFTASCSSAHSNLFTYQWNTSETENILQVSDAATHTVTVQDTNGCSATASASVTILPLPQGIISGNTSLCPGESSILTASGANRYLWNTGASTPVITVNTSGTYTCTFTNSNNCSMSQSVEVNIFENPVISGNLNICEGGSTTLTASGGNAYLWNNGAQTPSITVNNAGTYIVTATSGNCSATASVTTSVISLPQVSINGNTVICSGIGTTLTANEGTTYLWSNGASTQSIIANNPGTYAVTVSDAAGCTNSASVNVTLMDNVTISGVPNICQGESTTLSVSNEGNYLWSNGANTSFISVSQPGNYSVTVTLPNGCSSSATINVTEASNPTPAISGNTSICEGQSTTLTANGGNSYLWSNGSSSNNISVSQSGTYTVTATNVEGCSAIAQVNVTVNPLPNVYISGNCGFCQGGDVQLTANGANSYSWSNGSTNANITVSNAGTYSVTGTDANGCTNTATKSISVNPTYTIPLTHSICEGESYNFYGQSLTTAGTYTHTLQTVAGCDSVLSLTLSIKALPTPIITGNTTLCEGESTTLTATGGNSYMWSNGSTNNNISVSQSGVYTVTATNADGCSATANITVSVNPLPNVSISGNTTICQGSNTTLTANGADSYSWSTGENTASINVSAFGIYTVIGTSATGCSNTATATVIVSQAPVITITGNTELCEGETTTLTANGGSSYLWSNGTTDANLIVNTAGTYQVIGYNEAGCNTMTETTVHIWQPATSEFTITTTEDCYEWNGQSYCQSGDYTQTMQTVHGCDSVVTLHLTITVGIEDYNQANVMKLYPNPTFDLVNVQMTKNNEQLDGVSFQVFDVYGRLLEVINMADARGMSLQTIQIDLSQYAKGVYFLKAVSEGKVIAVRKVVKR